MNHLLFQIADFLSRPPGFYWLLAAMLVCCIAVPFGINENLVTFGLSVAAIVITGVVLIQGYRDTAAIQAKLDELILAIAAARNELVGLEKKEPEKITQEVKKLEDEAHAIEIGEAGQVYGGRGTRSKVRKKGRHRPEDR